MNAYGRLNLETLREREERVTRERRNRLLGLVTVFVAFGFFCALGGFLFGYRYGVDKANEVWEAKPRPTVSAPANALTQWSCTKQEGREYLNACASRIRTGKVK